MSDGKVVIATALDNSGLENGLKNMASSIKGTLAALGVGFGIAKMVTSAISSLKDFDYTLAKAKTLFGDVDVSVSNLSKNLLELSGTVGISADQINEGLYQALSAGVPVTEDMAQSTKFLEQSARLAVSGFTDLPTAIDATTKTLNAYKLGMDDAERIQNIMMQTQNKGIVTVGELSDKLAQVTPTASAFSVSFEQVGAALASMTAQGTPARMATTQLNQLISELGKDGTEASKALKQSAENAGLAETTFLGMMESGMTLDEVLALLQETADKNNLSLLDMFSSIEAGKAALALGGKNASKFVENLDLMYHSENTVTTAYNKMTNTLQFKSSTIGTKFKNLGTTFLDEFKQPLLDGLDAISGVLDDIQKYIPVASIVFQAIGNLAEIMFTQLQRSFENAKNAITEFLESTGFDTIVSVIFEPVGDFWENLKAFVADGDVSHLIDGAEDALKIATGFVLAKTAFAGLGALINKGMGLTGAGKGALLLGALSVGVKFADGEMSDEDWFKIVKALALGLGTYGLTHSFTASGLVFTVALNFDVFDGLFEGADAASSSLQKHYGITADMFFSKDFNKDIAKLSGLPLKTIEKMQDSYLKETLAVSSAFSKNLFWDRYKDTEKLAKLGGTETGKAFLDGLGIGLEDIDAMSENRASELISVFKTVIQSHSPSKVAIKIGGYFAEGLGIGMDTETVGKERAEGLIKSFNDELGIHSASKVAKESGEWWVEGFKNGTSGFWESIAGVVRNATDDVNKELSKSADESVEEVGGAVDSAKKSIVAGSGEAGGAVDDATTALEAQMAVISDLKTVWGSAYDDRTEKMKLLEAEINKLTEEGLQKNIDKIRELKAEWDELNSKQVDFKANFKAIGESALSSMAKSFGDFFEALVSGEDAWDVFAKSGLNAIASILDSLSYELVAQAVANIASPAVFAQSMAGAVGAGIGAGIVRGWAGSFATGGVVGQSGVPFTGHDNLYASVKAGETILNHAQAINTAKLLERDGSRININFYGTVYGDKEGIAIMVYDKVKSLQREGRIDRW